MKLNFQNNRGSRRQSAHSDLSGRTSAATSCTRGKNFQPSTSNLQPAAQGMALVITLILLAVTLVMAIAFLAISRRERGSITTSTDTATARLAADSALAAAEGQIIANILSTTNPYNYSLLVSTNYINPAGFFDSIANTTNVNYDFVNGTGVALNQNQFEQNLANLYYSPRPPVYVPSPAGNYSHPTNYDFRFYLDLNRNGTFDTNGLVPDTDNTGAPTGTSTTEVGDPEWIGVLERPDASYAANNQFLSRYAFIALPVGNNYDLNYIHNQALIPPLAYPVSPMNSANDGYLRNQGVGSWEINLAAFLDDLNTNQWEPIGNPYQYNQPANPNRGAAFEDALSLLSYRYASNYNSLATMQATLGVGFSAYLNGNIDLYTAGNLMTNTQLPLVNYQNSDPSWVGSDNTNHFFDLTTELFDPTKIVPTNFIGRLQQAGNGVSTYDRYTFYRLLDQLGTDSTPESGKMNLNYDNLDNNGNVVPGAETNFNAWVPIKFFTNAADRMLKLYTANWLANDFIDYTNTFGGVTNAFGVANIPVLVNGRMVYSSAVQRVLQLAANIYDATTTNFFPSVFQPIFSVTNGDVYINNFAPVTDTSILTNVPLNLNVPSVVATTLAGAPNSLVFGVPLIIGAKKGFPNFNQFAMQTSFELGRKLQMTRTSTNHTVQAASTYPINQMFFLNISNQLVVECWNSYTNDYARPVNIYATNYMTLTLTNDEPGFSPNGGTTISGSIQILSPNVWSHYDSANAEPSLQIPVFTNLSIIPDSIYRFNPSGTPFLIPDTTNATYETNVVVNGSKYPQPLWGLTVTNNLQVIMVDASSGRLIDYVQLSGPNTNLNINLGTGGFWGTNLNNGVPAGIGSQIAVSLGLLGGGTPPSTAYWGSTAPQSAEDGIDGFRAFYTGSSVQIYHNPGEAQIIASALSTNAWQLPYTPSTNFMQYITWQANDPLVHYLGSDLNDTKPFAPPLNPLIASVPNDRYQPWNKSAQMASVAGIDQRPMNLAFKDPLVMSSDYWDFPTNKFPTIGWLGRVHRGTPWQTVYLKASNILKEQDPTGMNANYGANTWENWTGNMSPNDAANSGPLQDRLLFDLFTTTINDNATRGQLSVNQTHFPAWSALFSGMIVPTNLVGGYTVINPGGVNGTNSAVFQLFSGITTARAAFTNSTSAGAAFTHIGDVLSTSALTEQSPFLTGLDPNTQINDEMYEWLPQQMMSLLRVSTVPRFVIYSYGQTLAPAPNSVLAGGGAFSGMVTNYQVVAETITRAVVRIEGAPTNAHAIIESFNILPPN